MKLSFREWRRSTLTSDVGVGESCDWICRRGKWTHHSFFIHWVCSTSSSSTVQRCTDWWGTKRLHSLHIWYILFDIFFFIFVVMQIKEFHRREGLEQANANRIMQSALSQHKNETNWLVLFGSLYVKFVCLIVRMWFGSFARKIKLFVCV